MTSPGNPGGPERDRVQEAPGSGWGNAGPQVGGPPAVPQYGPGQAYGQGQAYAPGQPYGPGMPVAFGLQMRQRSEVGTWLLGWVTFGIYYLVYWYKIHSELLEFDRRRHISPGWELMCVWLLSWTVVLPILSVGGLAGKIRAAQSDVGLPENCSGAVGVLLSFCFGLHVIYYQSKLNEIIAATGAAPGQRIALRV